VRQDATVAWSRHVGLTSQEHEEDPMATNPAETTDAGQTPAAAAAEADRLRALEGECARALVAGDLGCARALHADDFQLIIPGGMALTKDQYLGGIASGAIQYRSLEVIGEIAIRLYGAVALLRYQAEAELLFHGVEVPRTRIWKTDTFELRDGRWQVVWSQATAIPGQPYLP
jgi:hypothetical protein